MNPIVREVIADAPSSILSRRLLSIDTETTGLDFRNDRIGVIQVYDGEVVWVVRPPFNCTNVRKALEDSGSIKIFHNAIFDLRFLMRDFFAKPRSIQCTKVAAKILLDSGSATSLKELVNRFFGVVLDKSPRLSDWEASRLNKEQLTYAAKDACYLPKLMEIMLRDAKSPDRVELVRRSFDFLPTRAELDLLEIGDVFKY
ncbi:MAG TPA: ribonuclease D [Aquimonas sp.]|nr:ribonuclease D [Aquimonas sp.]HRF54031.1 ribonuclease D [Aquimonas sp.]